MYRAILPNGQLECVRYERGERGVELYDGDEELLALHHGTRHREALTAFVPYQNLEALLTEAAYEADEPSVM